MSIARLPKRLAIAAQFGFRRAKSRMARARDNPRQVLLRARLPVGDDAQCLTGGRQMWPRRDKEKHHEYPQNLHTGRSTDRGASAFGVRRLCRAAAHSTASSSTPPRSSTSRKRRSPMPRSRNSRRSTISATIAASRYSHQAFGKKTFDKSRIRYVSYDRNAYRDRDHRPPLRADFRGFAPRAGMQFHQGHWHWQGNQWVWIVGTWLIAAQMSH